MGEAGETLAVGAAANGGADAAEPERTAESGTEASCIIEETENIQ